MIFKRNVEVYKIIFNDLEKISDLFKKEEKWCKRSICRDINGNQLFDPNDSRATSWCILGACHKFDASEDTFSFLDYISQSFKYKDISSFNDHSTWEEIKNFCQYAKKLTKKIKIVNLYTH